MNLRETRRFREMIQGNVYVKPEESPEIRFFCIVNKHDDLYKTPSGFSFLISKLSNLSIVLMYTSCVMTKVVGPSDVFQGCILRY